MKLVKLRLNKNTDVMQQNADFITADFLYMFRASWAHHQEYKIFTRQPPVQVVMVAAGSSLRHNMACASFLVIVYFLFGLVVNWVVHFLYACNFILNNMILYEKKISILIVVADLE